MAATFHTLISVAELRSIFARPSLKLFDARFSLADPEAGHRAYEQGHIPGAEYVDLNRELSASVVPGKTGRHPLPPPEEFAERLRAGGVSAGDQVVVYDEGEGAVAARLWWMLRWIGHEAVAVLDGGFAAWLGGGHPTSSEVPCRLRGDLQAHPRSDLVARLEDVAAGRYRLVDARGASRFRGEYEPIDPVAGHIPGAVNLPYTELVRDGQLLAKAELAARTSQVMPEAGGAPWAAYCGSGVTACHLILAAAHAGRGDVRLYPGSFSEWITSAERAVQTGDPLKG